MRLIHCEACARRARYRSLPASEDGPGETVRRVDGRALACMLCDGCNAPLAPGDRATAWSAWRDDQQPLPGWEREYLTGE